MIASLQTDRVIVAAGGIACGSQTPGSNPCRASATADLIRQIAPTAVLALGDNQAERGSLTDYNGFYTPSWGAFKSITYPVPGDDDYKTTAAAGYFDYFNGAGVQTGRAGARGKGYYSYDIGNWHHIALNSNCEQAGGCGAGSAQDQWLRADLASHPAACTIAYWHRPLFSSGSIGGSGATQALWQALYEYGADVILTGGDFDYERFNPQTATGVADPARGIRSFVVGTGGKAQKPFSTVAPNTAFRRSGSLGVLKLTLRDGAYDWQFVAVPGDPPGDAGSATCVGATQTAPNQAPSANIATPGSGWAISLGTNFNFTGAATDPEDGTLNGSSLVWRSSVNGQIGTGASMMYSGLSAGSHLITLTATDSRGATAIDTLTLTVTTNAAPVPTITSPSNGTSVLQGTGVAFLGSATDAESGSLSGAALVWTSSINGQIGTGTTFGTTALSVGTHTITLRATDPQGASATTTRTLTITAPITVNTAPVPTIASPANGATVAQGSTMSFSGSALDVESGSLTGAALVWTSNLSGQIGTGTSFSTSSLVAGTHTITLRATDPQGASATTSRSITVSAPAAPTPPPSTGSAEPTGMTMIEDRPFNCQTSTATCEPGWAFSQTYANAFTIVQDATAPRSGSNVAQQVFTSSLPGGSSPATVERSFSGRRTLYVATWMKLSSNFQGHPTSTNKMVHYFVNGGNRIYLMARGTGTGQLVPSFGLQGLDQAYYDGVSQTATSVNLLPNVNQFTINRGQWHKYEVLLTANTSGAANGTAELWVDGVKVMSYTGIMFFSNGGMWDAVQWSPTWGGGGGTITSTFSAQLDHMYISGK